MASHQPSCPDAPLLSVRCGRWGSLPRADVPSRHPSQEENQAFPSLGAASFALGLKPGLELFLLTRGASQGELAPPLRAEEEPAQPGLSVEPKGRPYAPRAAQEPLKALPRAPSAYSEACQQQNPRGLPATMVSSRWKGQTSRHPQVVPSEWRAAAFPQLPIQIINKLNSINQSKHAHTP